jgi:hypothetical protein
MQLSVFAHHFFVRLPLRPSHLLNSPPRPHLQCLQPVLVFSPQESTSLLPIIRRSALNSLLNLSSHFYSASSSSAHSC